MYVGRISRRSTNVDCGGSIPRPQKPKTPVKKIPISPPSSEENVSDNSNSSSFTTLDDISEDAVVCILSFLSPDEISACRCLNRRLRNLCSDDRRVWLEVCQRRWGASTEVRRWGSGKIEYRWLYHILERWDNLVGFWRGVGHGGNGPLVVFDWGPCCIVASRIMAVKVGSYEVCKVPFLWTGVSGEGKSLSFINPDWLPDSGFSKGKGIEGGSGLFTVIDDGGFQLFAGLDGGADGGSGFSKGKKEENMCNGFRVDKVKNPFENMYLEDCLSAGLMSVNLSFVGNSHIVVEENQDRRWVKNHQAQELLLGRSNSYSDLSKKRSVALENGACSPPGSLPDRLQSEIYEYFANKVSPSGVRAARKQRRKDKERAAGYGRRKWEAEHFVKVAHWFPTPARPLQGLWKGIFDSMGLDFILVSYDEHGGLNFAGDLAVGRAILIFPCKFDLGFTRSISLEAMAGVSTATGFASNVSSNILSSLWNKAAQVIKDITSLPQAVTEMEDQAQRLGNVVHGINEKLNQEQKPPQTIVKAWLEKAGQVIESSRSISNEYQQGRNCVSCCPNCFSRYKISKRVGDWKVKVAQLHSEKEADFPANGEYGEVAPPTQMPIQTPKFFGNGIEAAQSEVESLLIEEMGVRVIGVCGMGGVGKTSLLQTINNSDKVCQSFNPIIWVTVSKDHNILNLQKCIAGRLNITLPDECDFEARKSALYSYLKNKNFLLILDDMWESLELESLGVSLNDTPSYKILLSTRSTAVCAQMKVNKIITVKQLSEEEAWQLFCSRAFLNGNVPHEIEEDTARKVAGECKGLPLAINVIAAAMRSHSYQHEWEHALLQMQDVEDTFYDMHNEIEKNLFQRLKWSYNVLTQYMRICFLYFAAYPEDQVIKVEEIIDLWVAEGLVKGSGENYLVDTAHSFLNQLSDRCLIEVVYKDYMGRIEEVKIHDVLRDLAIRIAEKEHSCYFREAGRGVSKFPTEEVVGEGCAKLSLMRNNLLPLPTTFSCSSLSVLLLNENHSIKEVPGCFLNNLPLLRVLDLSRTCITSLPPCIGNLKHLVSLQLAFTDISELPESIGDLKELQFLNLSWCGQLRCLPERISELKLLRALDISLCGSLKHLPRGISQLISLERLRMYGSEIALEFEEEANAERKNACLKDLKTLTSLRVFSATMKSPVKEGVFGNWSKMRHLSLNSKDASGQDYLPEDMQAMKDLESLTLHNYDLERLRSWVTQFRKLFLWGYYEMKELAAQLPCLRSLRSLEILGCDKLEKFELGTGFPKLERLSLWNLGSLECVEVGAVVAASASGGLREGASLPMLKTLKVYKCPKLKRLRGGWDKMNHLEEIRGSTEWWDAIEWEDPNIKTLLQNKFRPR